MPVEVHHSPPPLHHPGDVTKRPKGILKNPSFSGPSGPGTSLPGTQPSPTKEDHATFTPTVVPADAQESRDLTAQNTLQNAGPRRSSSAARRASQSRRHSTAAAQENDEDPDKVHLTWDEANLYLAEQESGTRMKITEPKTPYQFGDQNAMDEDEEEDVAIDPRYVNVDEMDMGKNSKAGKKHRESEIPGLELGEAEEDVGANVGAENDRIVRGSLSREYSKEKHVSVDEGTSGNTLEELNAGEKHRQFEEQRKKHYEMGDMKGLLGHTEDIDKMDEDDRGTAAAGQLPPPMPTTLPTRSVNGER